MSTLATPRLEKTQSQASLSASTAIIYEVNLSVPVSLTKAYVEYLRDFTKQVCRENSGFLGCQVFSQPKP
ncbi:hypothetical protein HK096_011594, partial [Nowakowskiella sp. JEL0078]